MQAASPNLTTPTPTCHCTTPAENVQPPMGIRSVTFQLSSPNPVTQKANSLQTLHQMDALHHNYTLQIITSQGSMSVPIKVDPGADSNMIPSASAGTTCCSQAFH